MPKYGIVEEIKFNRRYFCTEKVLVNGTWFNCGEESPQVGDVVKIHKYPPTGYKSAILVPDWVDFD